MRIALVAAILLIATFAAMPAASAVGCGTIYDVRNATCHAQGAISDAMDKPALIIQLVECFWSRPPSEWDQPCHIGTPP